MDSIENILGGSPILEAQIFIYKYINWSNCEIRKLEMGHESEALESRTAGYR